MHGQDGKGAGEAASSGGWVHCRSLSTVTAFFRRSGSRSGPRRLDFGIFEWRAREASGMRGHYIVCGLGIVGYRAVELLHRLGESVVVVTLLRPRRADPDGAWPPECRWRSPMRAIQRPPQPGHHGGPRPHPDDLEGRPECRDRARRAALAQATCRSSCACSTRTWPVSSRPPSRSAARWAWRRWPPRVSPPPPSGAKSSAASRSTAKTWSSR